MKISFRNQIAVEGYQIISGRIPSPVRTTHPDESSSPVIVGDNRIVEDQDSTNKYYLVALIPPAHRGPDGECVRGDGGYLDYRTIDFTKNKAIERAFSRFASIKSNEDVLSFANQYGPLGITFDQYEIRTGFLLERDGDILYTNICEPVFTWKVEARMFNLFLKAKQAESVQELCQIFTRRSVSQDYGNWMRSEIKQYENMTIEQAKSRLGRRLNGHFSNYLRLGIGSGFDYSLAPINLHAALWAEMARYFAGDTEYNECRCGCEQWFRVGNEEGLPARQTRFFNITHRNAYNNKKRSPTRAGRAKKVDNQSEIQQAE